jgi:hypothetical protein
LAQVEGVLGQDESWTENQEQGNVGDELFHDFRGKGGSGPDFTGMVHQKGRFLDSSLYLEAGQAST